MLVHLVVQLCVQIRAAGNESNKSKKRVAQLANRVEWYKEKFAQVSQVDASDYQPVSAMKVLLEDILQFIHTSSKQKFAVTSLYKAGSYRDAIDDFHLRLDRARDDLQFVFKPCNTPEPLAVCVGEEVDYTEQLAELRSNNESLRSELEHANLNMERLAQIVQAKHNASVARSQALLSDDSSFAFSPGQSENPILEMVTKLKELHFEEVEARALASKLIDGGYDSVNKLKGERIKK